MTDPRKQSHLPYLRSLADRMGLRDWAVRIADADPSEGNMATIGITYGQRHATVWLSPTFLESSPDSRRKTLVHELTHCHLEQPWEVAKEALPEPLHAPFHRLMEHATDAVAVAWAETLPLPPQIKPTRARTSH